MSIPRVPRAVLLDRLLIGLIILDIALAVLAIAFPGVWFELFHGIPYIDPDGVPADRAGLLPRTGAIWASFVLFQTIALVAWRRAPHWLCVVAGIRSTEMFSDWAYILFAYPHITWFGYAALAIAPVSNLFLTWFFIQRYRREVSI